MDIQSTNAYSSKAAVVGFGRAGQAIADYLAHSGAEVFVSESRSLDELSSLERRRLERSASDFEGGGHSWEFLKRAETIVVSPGVDYQLPVLKKARRHGIEICGELALAAGKIKAPVIAVTGTNGKTTVTELIGALLKKAGRNVFVGGNIGTPIGEYLLAPEGYETVVLEVSSFQLELCGSFKPQIGVLLNLSPDHLDRHGTWENYVSEKMKLFQGGRDIIGVVNGDDASCLKFKRMIEVDDLRQFGGKPEYDGYIAGNSITVTSKAGPVVYSLDGSGLANLSGRYNAAAALLAVEAVGLVSESLQQTLREFSPGRHRLQSLDPVGGVNYVNDSKATNTGAVEIAIRQIGPHIILIAGGKDKGDDYRLLRESVQGNVKLLILIGEAAGNLEKALGDVVNTRHCSSLEEAVLQAASNAAAGDTVLLSPACASFDMFKNYIDRGERFIVAVRSLAEPPSAVQANS